MEESTSSARYLIDDATRSFHTPAGDELQEWKRRLVQRLRRYYDAVCPPRDGFQDGLLNGRRVDKALRRRLSSIVLLFILGTDGEFGAFPLAPGGGSHLSLSPLCTVADDARPPLTGGFLELAVDDLARLAEDSLAMDAAAREAAERGTHSLNTCRTWGTVGV